MANTAQPSILQFPRKCCLPSTPTPTPPPSYDYGYGGPLPAQLSSGYQCHQRKCAGGMPAKAVKPPHSTSQEVRENEPAWTVHSPPEPQVLGMKEPHGYPMSPAKEREKKCDPPTHTPCLYPLFLN